MNDAPLQLAGSDHHVLCDTLYAVLRRDGIYRRRIRTMRWAWFALAVSLAMVLLDAAWPAPPLLRLALLWTGAVIACIGAVWAMRTPADAVPVVARRLEKAHACAANPLINAWQLAADGSPLARRAVANGAHALTRMNEKRIMDRAGLRREGACLIAGVLVWLMLAIAMPQLVGGGLLRLLNPMGDYPPFSLTTYVVAMTPEDVVAGDNVMVNVEVNDPSVTRLELVEWSDTGQPTRRWPMAQVTDGRFLRTLVKVNEPMTFYVESPRGRSRRHRIEPRPRPPAVGTPSRDATTSDYDTLRAVLRDIHQRAHHLLQQAIDAGAAGDRRAWRQQVAQLDAMRVGVADLVAVGAAPMDAPDDATIVQWLQTVQSAAAAARGRLGDSADPTASGHVSEAATAATATAPAGGGPLASGRYDERVAVETGVPPQLRATVDQAPRAYRRLVADYFRLLNESTEPSQEGPP